MKLTRHHAMIGTFAAMTFAVVGASGAAADEHERGLTTGEPVVVADWDVNCGTSVSCALNFTDLCRALNGKITISAPTPGTVAVHCDTGGFWPDL